MNDVTCSMRSKTGRAARGEVGTKKRLDNFKRTGVPNGRDLEIDRIGWRSNKGI